MRAIGTTDGGSVMVEMHARELRGLKALAEGLASMAAMLPNPECGDDGVVQIAPKIHPPARKKATPAKAKKAAGKPKQAAGTGKKAVNPVRPKERKQAVLEILRAAAKPLGADEILAGCQAKGIVFAGKQGAKTALQQNLGTWPEIVRPERGMYAVAGAKAAVQPAGTAPAPARDKAARLERLRRLGQEIE